MTTIAFCGASGRRATHKFMPPAYYAKKAKRLFYTDVRPKRNLATSSPVAPNSVPRNRLQHWDRHSAKGAIYPLGRELDVAIEPPRHQRHQSADNILRRSVTTLG